MDSHSAIRILICAHSISDCDEGNCKGAVRVAYYRKSCAKLKRGLFLAQKLLETLAQTARANTVTRLARPCKKLAFYFSRINIELY